MTYPYTLFKRSGGNLVCEVATDADHARNLRTQGFMSTAELFGEIVAPVVTTPAPGHAISIDHPRKKSLL